MKKNEKMKEFEIKSKLSEGIKKKLLLEFPKIKHSIQVDTYYDIQDKTLFKHGVFIRVRDEHTLDIKYNPDVLDLSHTVCDEYSYKFESISSLNLKEIHDFVSDVVKIKANNLEYETLDDLFIALGLNEFVTIVKKRCYLSLGEEVECVIDEIQDIGTFIEIEVNDEKNLHKIDRAVQKYHLKNIPIGYVELWLRANDFETYKRGRYLLEEDI